MNINNGIRSTINKDTMITLYYVLLLLLTFLLTKPEATYSHVMRYMYMVAVVAPLFLNKSYTAFALPLFWGVSQASFTPLLPTTNIYLLLVVIVLSITQMTMAPKRLLSIVCVLYLLCVELLSTEQYLECAVCGAATILISCLVFTKQDVQRIGIAFSLMSLLLSILFLIYFEDFSDTYASIGNEEVERASWINANVFGGVIGIGMVSSVFLLTLSKELLVNKWGKFACVVTSILSLVVLIMNASRGALSASVISSVILLLSSKIKKKYLVLIFLGLAGFVIALYNAGYFELLELRTIGDDNTTDTAGGRTEIWEAKLNAFADLPILQQLFGVGYSNCVNLGVYFDTHNDFVTALCAYGYVGLLSFIVVILYPLFVAKKAKKIVVLGLLLFLVLECVVLSPILRGYFIFFVFYLMIAKFAVMTNSLTEENVTYDVKNSNIL